jgi:hypothetical protein
LYRRWYRNPSRERPSLGHPEADWQFTRTAAAQRPRSLERDDLHDHNDDLLDVVTTVANQERPLGKGRTKRASQILMGNLLQFDGQVHSSSFANVGTEVWVWAQNIRKSALRGQSLLSRGEQEWWIQQQFDQIKLSKG